MVNFIRNHSPCVHIDLASKTQDEIHVQGPLKRKMLDKTECTVRYRRVNCQSVRTILTHHLLLQSVNCLWDWLREFSSQLTLQARPTSADRISLFQTLSIYNTGPSLLALSDVGTQDPISTLSHVSVARMPKGTFAHVTST